MSIGRARFEALLLLLVAMGLGAYLWSSRGQTTIADHEGRQAHLLPMFDQERVRKIVITSGGPAHKSVVLRRNGASSDPHDFFLGTGDGASADRAEVQSLLKTLELSTFLRLLDKSAAPTDALRAEDAVLNVELELDSVSYQVTIGGQAAHPPLSRYARTTGDDGSERNGVVTKALLDSLSKDSGELLGRLLFPYAKSLTKALSIEGSGGKWSLEADALGFRLADGTRQVRADPARVDSLFFQLARAGIEAFPDTPNAVQSPIVVRQVPESGREVRLEIGGACPGQPELLQVVRTTPDPLVGCTSDVLLPLLEPRDLPLRGLWSLRTDEIDHIAVTKQGHTLDLIRDGTAFRRLSPDPGPIALERGNRYLQDLRDFTGEASTCAGQATGEVRVVGQPEGSAEGQELRLTLLQHGDESLIRREDDGVCLTLTERMSWLLEPTARWYESLEILSVAADDIVALVSSGPELGREEVRRTDAGLTLVGGQVDEALLDQTLDTLAPLRADRIAPPWSSRPWRSRFDVHIEAKTSGPFDLRIGPRVRGGFLAALAGRQTEFVLSPDVVRSLETSLHSRVPAQWNPQAFSELLLTAHGASYHFRRLGDELVPMDDSPRELGEALLEALSGLVPAAAVRQGSRPAPTSTSVEGLKLEGSYDSGDGKPQHLTIELGVQVLYEGRPAQLMTIDGHPRAYYVDRSAVLSVLDLL